jgi:hypothetical protein
MSLAGLIGGVEQQIEKTWGITWGKLPQNNRRLVILDEASGLKTEDIGKLSSIRSSGVATIEKIRNQSTEAKTRLLWLSNPRESMTVNQFSSGIDIIETLCPAPEDVARFDVAIIVSKDDVDPKMIRRTAKNVKHVYTSKLCHDLVLWCWTRSPQEVIISEETKEACFDEAEKLSSKYSSDFPLVIGAEQRLKMARLAVALAGRLYSTDDGKRLLVLPCHVRYISDFLDRLYSNKHFGYDNWSVTRTLGSTIINISIIEKFMEKIKRLGCLKMLELKKVCLRDLEETMGITSDEARTHIAMLYTNNAIRKGTGIYYTKSPQFNDMLREFGHKNIDTPEREF